MASLFVFYAREINALLKIYLNFFMYHRSDRWCIGEKGGNEKWRRRQRGKEYDGEKAVCATHASLCSLPNYH